MLAVLSSCQTVWQKCESRPTTGHDGSTIHADGKRLLRLAFGRTLSRHCGEVCRRCFTRTTNFRSVDQWKLISFTCSCRFLPHLRDANVASCRSTAPPARGSFTSWIEAGTPHEIANDDFRQSPICCMAALGSEPIWRVTRFCSTVARFSQVTTESLISPDCRPAGVATSISSCVASPLRWVVDVIAARITLVIATRHIALGGGREPSSR